MDILKSNGTGQEKIKITVQDLYRCLKIEMEYDEWKADIDEETVAIEQAKEICLKQQTELGNMYFQYFNMIEQIWVKVSQIYAEQLKSLETTVETLKQENNKLINEQKRMKAKVIFADAVAASSDSILIGDLAKFLMQNGVETGQKRLFEELREGGYLMKNGHSKNMPSQKGMKLGLFEVKELAIINPEGEVQVKQTVKVTGKGQQYFINKYLK